MGPFTCPTSLETLTDSYPEPEILLNTAHSGGRPARVALAQLWLSEGIPHAFHKCPGIYESVRSWLSTQIDVHAKEIGLVGSARLGKSYVPSKFGAPFGSESDLDLFVVSSNLFASLEDEFDRWACHFKSGQIKPNAQQRDYWEANSKEVPDNIRRGFIDTYKVPNYTLYPKCQNINNAMWELVEKLKRTPNAPRPRRASIRCYSSWDSFVSQNSLNLKWASERRKGQNATEPQQQTD